MSRIYDAFIFCNELDLLECRLRELENTPVCRHIIVESPCTFQGNPKPYSVLDHQERFAPWEDRITYIQAEVSGDDPWSRQAAQREAVWQGLKDADPDDIVFFGDADEIPRPHVITEQLQLPVALLVDQHMFAADWRHPEVIACTVAARVSMIGSFEWMRTSKDRMPLLTYGGWHFSWLGGPDAIKAKARSYAHTELTDLVCGWADAGYLYEQGRAWGSDAAVLDWQLDAVEVDSELPRWIRERKCPQEWFRPPTRSPSTATTRHTSG